MCEQKNRQQPSHLRLLPPTSTVPLSSSTRGDVRIPCLVKSFSSSLCSVGRSAPAFLSYHAATAVAALATAAASAGVLATEATVSPGVPAATGPFLAAAKACAPCAAARLRIRAATRPLGTQTSTGTRAPVCGVIPGASCRALPSARNSSALQHVRLGNLSLQLAVQEKPCRGLLPRNNASAFLVAYVRGAGGGLSNTQRGSSSAVSSLRGAAGGCPSEEPSSYSSFGRDRRRSRCSSRSDFNAWSGRCYTSSYRALVANRHFSTFNAKNVKYGGSGATEASKCRSWRWRSYEKGKRRHGRRSSRSESRERSSQSRRGRRTCAQAAAGTSLAPLYVHDGQPEEGDVVNQKGLRLRTYVWKPCSCNTSLRRRRLLQQQHQAVAADDGRAPNAIAGEAGRAQAATTDGAGIAALPAGYSGGMRQKGSCALGWTRELVQEVSVAGCEPVIRCSRCDGPVRGVVLIVHGFGEHCRGHFLAKPLGPPSALDNGRPSSSGSSTACTGGSGSSGTPGSSAGLTAVDSRDGSSSLTSSSTSFSVGGPLRSSRFGSTVTRGGLGSTVTSGRCESIADESYTPQEREELALAAGERQGRAERTPVDTQLHYSGSWVERLNSEGFIVVGYDSQGHGMSEGWGGHRCCVEELDDYARDVLAMLRLTQLRFGGPAAEDATSSPLPVFVVGVSMGAWATARALQLAADSCERQALLPVIEAAVAAAHRKSSASQTVFTPAGADSSKEPPATRTLFTSAGTASSKEPPVPRAVLTFTRTTSSKEGLDGGGTEQAPAAREPAAAGARSASAEAPALGWSTFEKNTPFVSAAETSAAAGGPANAAARPANAAERPDNAAAQRDEGVLYRLLGARFRQPCASGALGRAAAAPAAGGPYVKQRSCGLKGAAGVPVGGDRASRACVPFLALMMPMCQSSDVEEQDPCVSESLLETGSTTSSAGAPSSEAVGDPSVRSECWNNDVSGKSGHQTANSGKYGIISSDISSSMHSSSVGSPCAKLTSNGGTSSGQPVSSHRAVKSGDAGDGGALSAFVHAALGLEGVVLLSPMFDVERRKKELKWHALRFAVLPLAFFFPSLPLPHDTFRYLRRVLHRAHSRASHTSNDSSQAIAESSPEDPIFDSGGQSALPPGVPSPASRKSDRRPVVEDLPSTRGLPGGADRASDDRSQRGRNYMPQEEIHSSSVMPQCDSDGVQQKSNHDKVQELNSSSTGRQQPQSISERSSGDTGSFQRLRDIYQRDPLTYKLSPSGGFVAALMRSADYVLHPQQMAKITRKTTKRILVIHNAEDPICDYRGAFLFCRGLLQSPSFNTPALGSLGASARTTAALDASARATAAPISSSRAAASRASVDAGPGSGFLVDRNNSAAVLATDGCTPAIDPHTENDSFAEDVSCKLVLLNARVALEKARMKGQPSSQPVGAPGRPVSTIAGAAVTSAAEAVTGAASANKKGKHLAAETLCFSAAAAAMSACPQALRWGGSVHERVRLLSALLQQQQPRPQQQGAPRQHSKVSPREAAANEDATDEAHARAMKVVTSRASYGPLTAALGRKRNVTDQLPPVAQTECSGTSVPQQQEMLSQQQEVPPQQQGRGCKSGQVLLVEGVGDVLHNLTNDPGSDNLFLIVKDWMRALPREANA